MSIRQWASRSKFLAVGAALCAAVASANAGDDAPKVAKTRSFVFTYGVTVTGQTPGKIAKIWLPVPQSSDDQTVQILSQPVGSQINREPKYGNAILQMNVEISPDGTFPVEAKYNVTRKEVIADGGNANVAQSDIDLFLKPDKMVPLGGKSSKLVEGKSLPNDKFEQGRFFYNVVNDHMKYSKDGTGWGRGDSDWACDSKFGNCTDFHSVFISIARANKIPSKFEIGFSVPTKRGEGDIAGYHCWAKFKPEGKGWIPVDISEANKNPKMRDYYFGNLTEDRVTFTTGRDIDLVPKQEGPALNYFVYPYVEVDGKPLPKESLKNKFGYKDLTAN